MSPVIEQSGLRPPGPTQGGVRPWGFPEDAWRGVAITTLPSGAKRYYEMWFTSTQIANSIAGCNRILEERAIFDAEQYVGCKPNPT